MCVYPATLHSKKTHPTRTHLQSVALDLPSGFADLVSKTGGERSINFLALQSVWALFMLYFNFHCAHYAYISAPKAKATKKSARIYFIHSFIELFIESELIDKSQTIF